MTSSNTMTYLSFRCVLERPHSSSFDIHVRSDTDNSMSDKIRNRIIRQNKTKRGLRLRKIQIFTLSSVSQTKRLFRLFPLVVSSSLIYQNIYHMKLNVFRFQVAYTVSMEQFVKVSLFYNLNHSPRIFITKYKDVLSKESLQILYGMKSDLLTTQCYVNNVCHYKGRPNVKILLYSLRKCINAGTLFKYTDYRYFTLMNYLILFILSLYVKLHTHVTKSDIN